MEPVSGMRTVPILAAFMGMWEILLILAMFAVPAAIVGVILFIVQLCRRDKRPGSRPPPLPTPSEPSPGRDQPVRRR